MATGNGRDSFDALIARGLGMSITGSESGCPDADLLAAFASQRLSAAEYTHWETHVAGCALCLHDVAAFARSGVPFARPDARAAELMSTSSAILSEDDESSYHAIRKSTRASAAPRAS
jgi:hypothetical protein